MDAASLDQAILDRLPHRPPFRFLSVVTSLECGSEGTAEWVIAGDESFLAGHFPGNPIVPGVLISEALAQLAGLVGFHVGSEGGDGAREAGDVSQGGEGRLAHVDVRFDRAVAPPATIALRAKQVRVMGALHQFEVEAAVEGAGVARGTLILARVPAAAP